MLIIINICLFGILQSSVWCAAVLPNDDCDGYTNGESWEPKPCMTCSCVDDRKICMSPLCYVPCDNPIQKEGECCPTCPSPPIKDRDCDCHRDGESWEEGPCTSCRCQKGIEICQSPVCYVPCENPIQKEGECCPTCPSPPVKDRVCDGHRDGESWEEGPCTSCRCQKGIKICQGPVCYVPCDNPIQKEGECCPTCPSPPAKDRDCDGHRDGESWEEGPCTSCRCQKGIKICQGPLCYVPCDNPIQKEGECCRTCPSPPVKDRDCDGHREGESWEEGPCTSCRCQKGIEICQGPVCYVPCDNPIQKEGECCPTCPSSPGIPFM